MKTEKELARKQNVQLSQEVRQLQEKVARQSGSLSNGLQDLKAHLDQKDLEKSQMVIYIHFRNEFFIYFPS